MTIPFGLVLMYTFSYQRDRLDFSSWENLAESGIQVIINHVKFWDTSEFLRHNGTTPDMRNVDIGWKLALTIVHICLIVFDYVLAILLEVLVFIMCFIVYRIDMISTTGSHLIRILWIWKRFGIFLIVKKCVVNLQIGHTTCGNFWNWKFPVAEILKFSY